MIGTTRMDIIGHGHRRAMLRDIARSGSLPHHAFLFSGPEGIGKRLVATEFVAELLGRPGEDPFRNQDFLCIEPESKISSGKKKESKRLISVDTVRGTEEFLSRFPAESSRRVVMIDDADLMNEQAQNALLKTLEEPNSTSVIVLVSSRLGGLLDTVVSRSFRVPFTTVPERAIREGIAEAYPESSLEPFFFGLGRPGLAISAVTDPERFEERRRILRLLFGISKLSSAERLALSEKLSETPAEAALLFGWWVSGLRNMGRSGGTVGETAAYYRLLEDVERTIRSLRGSGANPRLSIDRLFLVSF